MSDEPTEKELAEAEAMLAWLDGKPSSGLSSQTEEMLAFTELARSQPNAQRLDALKQRLVLRRKPRWALRSLTLAAAIAAALLVVWFGTRKEPLVPPGPELLEVAKNGDPQAIDLAMSAYRRQLVETGVLRAADAVYSRADAALARGDLPAAREALSTLTSAGGVVAKDAWFRLATVELRAGQNDVAVADADRGLSLGRQTDVFTLNLLLARAAAHKAKGDEDASRADLLSALAITEALTDAALKGE